MKHGPVIMWTVYAVSAIVCAGIVAFDEIRERRENRKPDKHHTSEEHHR